MKLEEFFANLPMGVFKAGEDGSPYRMRDPYNRDCYWYDEWQDMNAHIPTCKAGQNMDEYGLALETCKGCEYYHEGSEPWTVADKLPLGVPHLTAIKMDDTKDIFVYDADRKEWVGIITPGD